MDKKHVRAIGVTQSINDLFYLTITTDRSDIDITKIAKEITEKFKLHDYYIYSTKNGYQVRWYYDMYKRLEQYKKMRDIIAEYLKIIDYDWISIFLNFNGNIRLSGKHKKDIKLYKEVKVNREIDKKTKEAGDTLRYFCEKVSEKEFFKETF